jgi:MarR-like DNA-binding transcriptional regulator SgrR of sgrS sRNA
MMGDRLIGEAPEYALEQWLRCDMLWPNLLTGAQYAHLQATLDAVQSQPDARSRNDALRNVFNSLMEDAIMTPLFKYNYRISAPPGSMACASTPGAGSTSPAPGCRPRRRERAGGGGRLALPYRLYSFSQELP